MVLTGFGDGTAELVRVLNKIDSEAGAAQKKELQVVVLEHTQASEVRSTLQELIAPKVSQPGMRGPQGNVSSTTRITVDTRTNSLLIQARAQDMASIKEMIARLDVPTKQDVDGRNGSDE
jgi:type II secretory pathway component GspD/PulD (secretin)